MNGYGYGYNNIISPDSTYNQNSDIYLSNDIKKNAIKAYANRRNNTSLNKRSYLSQRNNTNDSTNRNKKSDKLGTRIRLTKSKNKNILKY